MNVRPLEGPPANALDALQCVAGVALPMTDPGELMRQIRRRNFARAQRLSPSEVAEMPVDYDPGPEYD